MSEIDVMIAGWEFNRGRTESLLASIEALPDPTRVLGWRPGPGRAHIAWQLMHIGVTEELFATERIVGTPADFSELLPRFKGGSTPDDNIPSPTEIRNVLEHSREHLRKTFLSFSVGDLDNVPEPLKERGWSLRTVLQVIAWHEPHHQGQAHLTLNLWKAQNV